MTKLTKKTESDLVSAAETTAPGRDDRAAFWLLRAMRMCGDSSGYDCWTESRGLLGALGLKTEYNPQGELDPTMVRRMITRRIEELKAAEPARQGPIFTNVHRLGGLLELDELEIDLLALAVLVAVDDTLRDCYLQLTRGAVPLPHGVIARIVDHPLPAVQAGLAPAGALRRSGLLGASKGYLEPEGPLMLMDGLAPTLSQAQQEEAELLGTFFAQSPPSTLEAADYDYAAEPVALVTDYLRWALDTGATGVNVLVHGPPGTGKTALGRLLVSELGARGYEVAVEDEEGDAYGGYRRLSAYQVSQHLLARTERALLIFDEIEDALPAHDCGSDRAPGSTAYKGFLGRRLERNQVPALWIGNCVDHLDPALLRRFGLILPLDLPPRKVRRRILDRSCEGLALDAVWRERMAGNPHLSPADIERAAGVVRVSASAKATPGGGPVAEASSPVERAMEHALSGSLALKGQSLRMEKLRARSVLEYDPTLSNADHDLKTLTGALGRHDPPRARICLYGPSGTGKTAWVRHLADSLDREVQQQRASDLLDKYIGVTEQRIAAMFRRARSTGALLLLDEADTFLMDRRGAEHGWEVAPVNELLVQLEHFEGLFCCCTNLLEHFDRAVFRRFDLKVGFGALLPSQRRTLLSRAVAVAEAKPLSPALSRRLDALSELTPGDFAMVLRRLAILGETPTPATVIEALTAECELKFETRPAVGFRV